MTSIFACLGGNIEQIPFQRIPLLLYTYHSLLLLYPWKLHSCWIQSTSAVCDRLSWLRSLVLAEVFLARKCSALRKTDSTHTIISCVSVSHVVYPHLLTTLVGIVIDNDLNSSCDDFCMHLLCEVVITPPPPVIW